MQISRSATQPGDTGSLDADTRAAIARFRFRVSARETISGRLPRAQPAARTLCDGDLPRDSCSSMTAINLLGGLAPLAEAALRADLHSATRSGVSGARADPRGDVSPGLQKRYQTIAATAVIIAGVSVMTISGIAAASGLPQFQMGDVLVLVYATLFLGLLFRVVVIVATEPLARVRDRRRRTRRAAPGPGLRGVRVDCDGADGGSVRGPGRTARAHEFRGDAAA